MPPCSRTLMMTSLNSGMTSSKPSKANWLGWPRWVVATFRSTKLHSQNLAIRMSRRLSRREATIGAYCSISILQLPIVFCAKHPKACILECIFVGATAAGIGTPRAATRMLPNGFSMRSRFRSIFSNSTPRVTDHKSIVIGLISSKTPVLEDKAGLRRRVEEASRHVALDRLAVSPQCGFASVDTGNPVTPEVQEAKLRLVVELANDIWGEA